jgi:hypothetical protein
MAVRTGFTREPCCRQLSFSVNVTALLLQISVNGIATTLLPLLSNFSRHDGAAAG